MSEYTLISTTEIYKNVIQYLDNGRATTPENIVLQKNGIKFEVDFNYSFTYDWSNGVIADEPEFDVTKSDGKDVTDDELSDIEEIIREIYRY